MFYLANLSPWDDMYCDVPSNGDILCSTGRIVALIAAMDSP